MRPPLAAPLNGWMHRSDLYGARATVRGRAQAAPNGPAGTDGGSLSAPRSSEARSDPGYQPVLEPPTCSGDLEPRLAKTVQLYLSVAFIAIVRKRGLERTSRPFNIPHTSQSHFNTHKHTHALSRPPCCFMTLRAQLFLSPPATGARGRLHTVFARRTLNVMRAHVMSLRTTHEAVSQLQIVDSVLRK